MQRITQIMDGNSAYFADNSNVTAVAGGYAGEAVLKLAKVENLCEELLAQQTRIAAELGNLRDQGKTHSVLFRELMIKN